MKLLNYKYVVIEGNIGSGKTSLAKKLNEDFKSHLVLEEFADNTFLPLFYENPEKFAFPLELSFLAARYHQLSQIFDKQNNNTIISDYHLMKSLLFAKINLPTAELSLYRTFFELITSKVPEPELIIFLNKSVKHLQQNISKRGRSFENGISVNYLENLNHGYDQLLSEFPQSKVLKIESENLDFIKNRDDYQSIIDLINKA